jgi:hypothetical protein
MPSKKPRLSLTREQIQAGVGAELLSLCQTVTADGVLTDEEIHELRAWLEANRSHDLPAIDFLVATLERILADGKVTKEERKELYAAIEKVLPVEARREAATHRKAVESEEKGRDREEREAQKQRQREEREAERHQEREERQRRRPVYSANFMVAGVHYEGRPEVIRRHVREGDRVYLVRDPHNRYSRNAIEVRLESGYMIGYVPEDYAPEVAPFLDDLPHTAVVTKVLRGGRVPIPVVQAYLYRKDADVEDLVFPDEVPAKRRYRSERRPSEREDEDFDDRPRKGKSRASGKGCLILLPLACAPAMILAAKALGLLN